MPVNTKRYRILALLTLLSANISGWGCSGQENGLRIADLDAEEWEYITRYVTIERAKAVKIVDPESGQALLDSLSIAWGDSSAAETGRLLPERTGRIIAVNRLLLAILAADEDSLVHAPRADRLTAPLPVPD